MLKGEEGGGGICTQTEVCRGRRKRKACDGGSALRQATVGKVMARVSRDRRDRERCGIVYGDGVCYGGDLDDGSLL